MLLLSWLLACSGGDAYIVEGTVVEVHGATEVVIDHAPVAGLMDAMVMPFDVRDPTLLVGVTPGDTVLARMIVDQDGGYLAALRVTGHVDPPPAVAGVADALRPGEVLPAIDLDGADGTTVRVGAGQGRPTVVAFLYTRCPLPEFCPLLVSRLQSLQAAVGGDARIVAITIDPEHDTRAVLAAFAASAGAKPETWVFARTEAGLADLAARASLGISRDGERIEHGSRLWVLDRDGRLIERYDDNRWPLERVVSQLATGGPAAPVGSDGTVTPP